MEALTLALSHGVEREEKEGKDFKSPLTLPSPAEWRGLTKGKDFRGTPHFCSLPQGERRDGRKNFKRTLTLALSCEVERGEGR